MTRFDIGLIEAENESLRAQVKELKRQNALFEKCLTKVSPRVRAAVRKAMEEL